MGKMKDSTIPEWDQYSHDHLCPVVAIESCAICLCELFAQVRADERSKVLEQAIGVITDMREDHIRWYRVALEDAADALVQLRHTGPPVDTTH